MTKSSMKSRNLRPLSSLRGVDIPSNNISNIAIQTETEKASSYDDKSLSVDLVVSLGDAEGSE